MREAGSEHAASRGPARSIPRQPHSLHRLHGPTLLIEYDNSQNRANHVHSVWHRSAELTSAGDLLRAHYERSHGADFRHPRARRHSSIEEETMGYPERQASRSTSPAPWSTGAREPHPWRGRGLGSAAKGLSVDWAKFADSWRASTSRRWTRCRAAAVSGRSSTTFTVEPRQELLTQFGIKGLTEAETDHLNRAWHRLGSLVRPRCPGSRASSGSSCWRRSPNGNVALIVNMARVRWAPVGPRSSAPGRRATTSRSPSATGPPPPCRARAGRVCMMVAAHNGDLGHASEVGLRTAFVPRPNEHGPRPNPRRHPGAPVGHRREGLSGPPATQG